MTLVIELPLEAPRPGFRLERVEVFNWGTFDKHVWGLSPAGDNALLTGDIGSGKSTIVDAITTLLVPPSRLSYNKAAGAEAKERTLRSYVLGYFKSERSESGAGARAIALRTHDSYSVILARFVNEGFSQTVTLAQIFWMKDLEGQPARMFVIADQGLSITEHFSGFGKEIGDLRKRLRRARCEIHDSFPPYSASFRRRFGIENEQALELFHQTVSMKSVGNLTDFVRQHMLQPFAVEPRISALIGHFDDLNRAHEAVLKAKAQIEKLEPIVASCARHQERTEAVLDMRGRREALGPWFADRKRLLLEQRKSKLGGELESVDNHLATLAVKDRELAVTCDGLKDAINKNGGGRLEELARRLVQAEDALFQTQKRAGKYATLSNELGLPAASDSDAFSANRSAIEELKAMDEARRADIQNERTEREVEFKISKKEHDDVCRELDSLRSRLSNIPARVLELRAKLCEALDLDEGRLPFAGELIQVRDEEREWEGAIERLLHNFGLSLLVPDELYSSVADWVDRIHLGARLVYYRVRSRPSVDTAALGPRSLVHKLSIKPNSEFYEWLEPELRRRFDYACCDTLEEFRRETRAMTRAGQLKGAGERHEKDDRHRLDDRSRYVLGWSNEAKIAAFHEQRLRLEERMRGMAGKLERLREETAELDQRLNRLHQLAVYDNFRDLDWKPFAVEIDAIGREQRALEASSDMLRALQERLRDAKEELALNQERLNANNQKRGQVHEKLVRAEDQIALCKALLDTTDEAVKARFAHVAEIVEEALGDASLTVESCENREREVRVFLQKRIENEDQNLKRLGERITQAMTDYRHAYPLETRETDAKVEAAAEYEAMLLALRTDGLPKFEKQFKDLLNENTIREVANFQSQLHRERQSIKERIETINGSLRGIDYNPGRYIVLEATPSTDADLRDFQQDLRACTEGTLTGSEDDAYSEAKFLQVKRIIERFRGRDGTSELDARWTKKVTDVRNWFVFSASERWREGDVEHEHYTDSGGKSGGQKEKLAYTVLAASLAYQFGLEASASSTRTFRFVVIDEAFGRGSDESSRYGLELFANLGLQLLVVTPLQKIHVIEPYVARVGFVHNEDGRRSMLRNLTIEQYREERAARIA